MQIFAKRRLISEGDDRELGEGRSGWRQGANGPRREGRAGQGTEEGCRQSDNNNAAAKGKSFKRWAWPHDSRRTGSRRMPGCGKVKGCKGSRWRGGGRCSMSTSRHKWEWSKAQLQPKWVAPISHSLLQRCVCVLKSEFQTDGGDWGSPRGRSDEGEGGMRGLKCLSPAASTNTFHKLNNHLSWTGLRKMNAPRYMAPSFKISIAQPRALFVCVMPISVCVSWKNETNFIA